MAKDKEDKNDYINSIHRIGRISTLISALVMVGIPCIICSVYDIWPSFNEVIAPLGSLLVILAPSTIAEVLSYAPVLGSGNYIAFITGNIMNLKLPCAINGMQMAGVTQGTEEGDAVSTVAVAVSSIVTMIVLAVTVVLLVPLTPLLTSNFMSTASNYMLPALFGCLGLTTLMNNKSGNYVIHNKFLIAVIPMILLVIFHFAIHSITNYEGYAVLCEIPLCILSGWILYKKGIVRVEDVTKDEISQD